MAVVEICVDSVESALEASAGGADRLELCSALSTGGLTPSLGFLRAVRSRVPVALHVMIRPRTGDFLYCADEISVMRDDISLARQAGAEGVVFGVLDRAGLVDEIRTRELVQAAGPMQVTFHRAFDLVPDPHVALETLIAAGVHRVLTSGGARTAAEGQPQLRELVHSAQDRITVMLGGGVRPENVNELARNTGAHEFHAALRRSVQSPMRYRAPAVFLSDPGNDETPGHDNKPGHDEYVRRVVRAADVQALKLAAENSQASLVSC